MGRHTAAWLAWTLAGLSMVMFLASVAFFVLTRAAVQPAPYRFSHTNFGESTSTHSDEYA
jgi:hypothetical protein